MIVFTAAHFLTTVSESEILYYADENINSGLTFTVRLFAKYKAYRFKQDIKGATRRVNIKQA